MLTKERILAKVTQEDLIKYLVPEFDPTIPKKNYTSKFSETDRRPSMSIYKDGAIWKFKSHNTGHQGDVFAMWGGVYGLDCRRQFPDILEVINREMCLGIETKLDKAIHRSITRYKPIDQEKSHSISYVPFTKLFLSYWEQFGITEEILNHFFVNQVEEVSFKSNSGRSLNFKYTSHNKLAACYHIDGRIKIYIPAVPVGFCGDSSFKEQKKSFGYKNQTKDDIFGLSQLEDEPLDYILFTAGEKDCMAAYARGFTSISMQSENQLPTEALLSSLRKQTTVLLSCYDNDAAGINASKRLEEKFGIVSIPLPEDVKDLAEYFQKYSREDFIVCLERAIEKRKTTVVQTTNTHTDTANESYVKDGDTIFHKIKSYLSERFEFRFNEISLDVQIKSKKDSEGVWEQVNDADLCVSMNETGLKAPLHYLQMILKSYFVKRYNPVQDYFLRFDNQPITSSINYIKELAAYIILEDKSKQSFNYWYTHLKKWMIRAIRTVLEPYAFNKHALILCSNEESVGKTHFCNFLCPSILRPYFTSNPTVDHSKDAQLALATHFIINLDELQQLKTSATQLKSWLSQESIKVRLPYDKTDTVKTRIVSFVGNTNDITFLRSSLGYSRWIGIRMVDTKRPPYSEANALLELAWCQAYHMYKLDAYSGELTKEELEEVKIRSTDFQIKSSEEELIQRYLSPSTKEKGEFMTATDILQYIQNMVGTSIRLNSASVGKGLKSIGFERYNIKIGKYYVYGYYVKRTTDVEYADDIEDNM